MPVALNSRDGFISSHLRSQIETLENILATMERENVMDSEYLDENLKQVEKNLHWIRKIVRKNK